MYPYSSIPATKMVDAILTNMQTKIEGRRPFFTSIVTDGTTLEFNYYIEQVYQGIKIDFFDISIDKDHRGNFILTEILNLLETGLLSYKRFDYDVSIEFSKIFNNDLLIHLVKKRNYIPYICYKIIDFDEKRLREYGRLMKNFQSKDKTILNNLVPFVPNIVKKQI
uniref:Uncharacterized protein n=1 Tax=Pyramimonas orientalis virus TaxID=455367 RepID=A0A7M3UP89_POV01|nr:hypothetical protein HWQ62_00431 [Pyramimonas orientalis virus]